MQIVYIGDFQEADMVGEVFFCYLLLLVEFVLFYDSLTDTLIH